MQIEEYDQPILTGTLNTSSPRLSLSRLGRRLQHGKRSLEKVAVPRSSSILDDSRNTFWVPTDSSAAKNAKPPQLSKSNKRQPVSSLTKKGTTSSSRLPHSLRAASHTGSLPVLPKASSLLPPSIDKITKSSIATLGQWTAWFPEASNGGRDQVSLFVDPVWPPVFPVTVMLPI